MFDKDLVLVDHFLIERGEIANNAYHACAHETKTLFTQFQGELEEKDHILEEREKMLQAQELKIIDLGNDLVHYIQKLKATSTFTLERDNLAKEAEERASLSDTVYKELA